MGLMPRGINHYSSVTQIGVGAAANTGFMISGSSSKFQNASLASGSRDIVQSDDEFQWGWIFAANAGYGPDSVLGFTAIDSTQITLGAPVQGAVRLSIDSTGKQVIICYRKVNDRD